MIATYDNLNNHIAKRKKSKNMSNFDDIVLGMIYGFFATILVIGYGSWLLELI